MIIRRYLQPVMRGAINPLMLRAFAARDYDLSNTLVLSGSKRSGTTWLSELVSLIPRSAILFEPIDPVHVRTARKVGFKRHNFLEPGDARPEAERLLGRILRGRLLTAWTTSNIPFNRLGRVDRWIVKLTGANRMLGWLTDRFPILPPALIIRHPCAVWSSVLERGWTLPRSFSRVAVGDLTAIRPELSGIEECLERLKRSEEFFAVRWCLDQYTPLSLPNPFPFAVVSFERLVRDGLAEMERLFSVWNIPMPEALEEHMRRPSAKASRDFAKNPDSVLTGWKRRLEPDVADRILNVVRTFGLEFYTEEPEPDYARLMGPEPIRKLQMDPTPTS